MTKAGVAASLSSRRVYLLLLTVTPKILDVQCCSILVSSL